jgi:uncharacterized protein (DUF697 family)
MVGFWRVVAEIDPHVIALQAIQHVSVAVVGPPDVGKETLRRALLGEAPGSDGADQRGNPGAVQVVEVRPGGRLDALPPAHLYLYVVDGGRGIDPAEVAPARQIESRGHRLIYVVNKADQLGNPEAFRYTAATILGVPPGQRLALASAIDHSHLTHELFPKMANALGDRALAMARTMPGTREAIAHQLIFDSARANGQFSLVSALPANIPVIGTLTALGADTLILTKNQALLVFKLAALHGRSLDSTVQLAAEITPVIGAAFVWRSIARSLVGLLPGLVSAVPKAAISFAGTYVVGHSAHYYYRWGHRPRRETLEQISREAAALAKRSVTALR